MSHAWDEAAWRALAEELDRWGAAGRRAAFWWRDDDAGRDEPALGRLLALAGTVGAPLGLAVVPEWLTPGAAEAIRRSPAAVAVVQHGFAHANHETAPPPGERKLKQVECGPARPAAVVLAELRRGHAALGMAFGPRFRPVLVPPWNRIAPAVEQGLPAAGYRGLSTFAPRPSPHPVAGLRQVNCHVDPIAWREGRRFIGAAPTAARLVEHLGRRRAGTADPDEPTGLLTHHRDLDPDFWSFLGELLHRLRAHPAAALPSLDALFGLAPPAPAG